MATGDVKGGLRKLEQRLRQISYPRDVDYPGLVKGDPAASLPVISYAFTCYSTHIAELLVSKDIELTAKSDLRFIDSVYKILRDLFNYKPVLTKQQFLQYGFSERKIQIVCDIVDYVVKKHKEFNNQNKSFMKTVSAKAKIEIFHPEVTPIQPLSQMTTETLNQKKTLVERHTGSTFHQQPLSGTSIPSVTNTADVSTSDTEIEFHCEPKVSKDEPSVVELLKIQLAECQEKLQRLNWIEERLETIEAAMKGKIIIDETDWNNLLSRVLLLETDKELQSRKKDLSSEFTAMREDRTSSRLANNISSEFWRRTDSVLCCYPHCSDIQCNKRKTNFKTKADLPGSHHQSSGYSSLLSADTSPIAIDINYSDLTEDSKETAKQRMERITKMMEETSKLLRLSNSS